MRTIRSLRFFKAGPWIGCLALSVAIASNALALKEEYRREAARVDSLEQLGRAALREGRGADAIDMMGRIFQIGLMWARVDFFPLISAEALRRYHEVFHPPADADSMAGRMGGWPEEPPATFGGIHGGTDSTTCYGPWKRQDDPCLVTKDDRTGRFTVDLGMDGSPEFVCLRSEVKVDPSLLTVTDRARDGRRIQWLVARPGQDPREQPTIWYYIDGDLYWLVVDMEGDGKGEQGISGFFK